MTTDEIINVLKNEIARETGLPLIDIADQSDFFSLGLDSISCVYVLDRFEKKIGLELHPIYFFDYPTIEKLSAFISTLQDK